jgi:hypothetical protein
LKKHLLITITFVIVLFLINFQVVTGQGPEETSIQNAKAAINQAFTNVLEAENAGGNITQLLTGLNNAVQLLAEAQNNYQTGTLIGVTSKANSAKQIADQVNTEAIILKDASLTLTRNNFWFIVTFSLGGAIVFGLLMVIIWQRFKRSHIKSLLSMKPEVVTNNEN